MPNVFLAIFILVLLFRVYSSIFMYFRLSSVYRLFMVLDSLTASTCLLLFFINILQRFLKRSLMAVKKFPLFFQVPSHLLLVPVLRLHQLGCHLNSMFSLTSSTNCEYLFWIHIANSCDYSLTVVIFGLYILNNFSLFS